MVGREENEESETGPETSGKVGVSDPESRDRRKEKGRTRGWPRLASPEPSRFRVGDETVRDRGLGDESCWDDSGTLVTRCVCVRQSLDFYIRGFMFSF